MNIKLKAILTVLGFFGALLVVAVGVISIPAEWVKRYGVITLEGIMVTVSFIFAYYIALDYYKGVEQLKRFDQQTERKIEYKSSRKK